nr:protein RALF-like 33 [Ipomoea batatas]
MKGGESHYCRRLFLFVVFTIFFVMLSTNVGPGECLSATNLTVGGGTVADFMEAGGGEEFLMDSETNSRFLAQMPPTKGGHLSYDNLKRRNVPCNAKRYGSCPGLKRNPKSNCNYHNRSCR